MILDEHFGEDAPWTHQATEVVKHALENAIRQLKSASFSEGQTPFRSGGQYNHPPRTREELLSDPAVKKDLEKQGWAF